MENKPILSAYKIWWAEFTPTTGRVVTKHDQRKLGGIQVWRGEKRFRRHFPSRDKALEFVTTFSGKLDKRYAVRFFSDKQFSMAKESEGYAIPFTKKQMEDVHYVG